MTVFSHHEYAYGDERHAFANPARATRIVTDPLGTQRTFGIVYAGNASIANAADEVTQFLEYSADELATLIKRPNGQAIALAYGPRQRLASSTVADSSGMSETTRYTYDDAGQLTRVVAPDGAAMELDAFGQQTSMSSPDTGTTTSQFDGAGNPDSSTDASARKTTYRFDAAHRVTRIGSSTFEYGKDGSGSTGRLIKMNDESGQSSYAYDGFGRMLAKIQTVGTGTAAKTFALAYTYGNTGTSAGHVTSITYPSGNRIDIGYGSDGHAINIAVTAPGANPVPLLGDIRYLPFGAVRAWTWR